MQKSSVDVEMRIPEAQATVRKVILDTVDTFKPTSGITKKHPNSNNLDGVVAFYDKLTL